MMPGLTLGSIERALIGIVLSMAITAIGGLALNWSPFGLRPDSWVVFLGGFTLVTCLVEYFKQNRQINIVLTPRNVSIKSHQIFIILLSIAMTVGAIAYTIIGEAQQPVPLFTEFWILPTTGSHHTIRVGICNWEASTKEYSVQVKENGLIVYKSPLIQVDQGKSWESLIDFAQDFQSGMIVEAELVQSETPELVYRHVSIRY
jgi:uncharacterized membrane protein